MKHPETTHGGSRKPSWFWSRLHYLIRILGLTGLVVGAAGLVMVGVSVSDSTALWATLTEALRFQRILLGPDLLLGGAAVALVAVLVELLVALTMAAGRRSAVGFNSLLQITLAVVLLVGVNVYSAGLKVSLFDHRIQVPGHYARLDLTRDGQFTLPAKVREELAGLHAPTRIIVYQQHKTFGSLTGKPDRYDYAAEHEVVEKIKDLVDLFRESGPHFDVQVLDVEEEGYEQKLDRLTKDSPKLHKAIEEALENSIFFQTQRPTGNPLNPKETEEHVQRLSFNDFYRLDKTASQQANEGRGNLVLLPQGEGGSGRGIETVARKVLNLEEKKPVVGIAVIHEYLTTRGIEAWGMAGLRKTLEEHGFEVRDIVLKRLRPREPVAAVVSTLEESKLDRIEGRLRDLDFIIARQDRFLREAPRDRRFLPEQIEAVRAAREYYAKLREQYLDDKREVDRDDVVELRRMTDLTAKFSLLLAECDVLILPRPTLHDTPGGDRNLLYWLHTLDEAQFKAISEFVKSGKPILACVGPSNEPEDERGPDPGFFATDGLDGLLGQLGFVLGKQTVLFDAEREAFSDRRTQLLTSGASVLIPSVLTGGETGKGGLPADLAPVFSGPPHPIRDALAVSERSLGKDRKLELPIRHPRPVYFERARTLRPGLFATVTVGLMAGPENGGPLLTASWLGVAGSLIPSREPTFLLTAGASWNEDRPFATDEYVPTDRSLLPNDPDAGTLDAHRRGPFSIAAAVETSPPAEWYSKGEKRPASIRTAVIGESWFLIGKELTPAKELLVLNTLNWLLGRDDLLARSGTAWSYPRVTLAHQDLWVWGARLGLPVLFAYLGVVVLLTRRLR
jgi:hypothetical protein